MTNTGVILYGPPASGKDTVTEALSALDGRYAYFHKLKVGAGRTAGYRLTTAEELDDLRERGQVLYEFSRYEATYAVDAPGLAEVGQAGRVPIVHMGQLAGIAALQGPHTRWLDVLLWCSRETTEKRLSARGSTDIHRRLTAWDETALDLGADGRERFTLSIRTDALSASTVAQVIHAAAQGTFNPDH
ncbi:guanylate kinase [Actinomadura barringtoniae]|uniref:Guanylate kinase n=1 Tax=Actinomadura barringtoniae TaxID=1427535 RepID=A0A939PPB5_9ACTN|nr:guanylate kinase [Actinomadura barringtoniae]MBO2453644.1 guanylate kinase [Actinomadura barringtoniae]